MAWAMAALWVCSASFAQERMPSPGVGPEGGHDEIPPELRLPDEPTPAIAAPMGIEASGGSAAEEIPVPEAEFQGGMNGAGIHEMPMEALGAVDGFPLPAVGMPAPLISSGTWFRRGFWYTEQDVVILNRDSFDDVVLSVDASPNTGAVLGPLNVRRRLAVESDQPGAAASARLTLGRFMFRDESNRDHTMEFTFFGLGEWTDTRSVESLNPDGLVTPLARIVRILSILPLTIDGTATAGGFQRVNNQRFTAETEMNSFEWNYRLRHRHTRDSLELDPDGHWTRRMQPQTLHGYVFGLRYLQMDDGLRWESQAILRDARGDMDIRTSNDLFGCHFGGDIIHQRERWSVGVRGKAGPFVNFSSQNTDLFTVDPGVPGSFPSIPPFPASTQHDRADEEVISFAADLGVFAHYHLHSNVALHMAYEALWLTSVATAIDQINFETGDVPIVKTGGSQMYMGMSFGVDFYW
jgi:hypothetical protein